MELDVIQQSCLPGEGTFLHMNLWESDVNYTLLKKRTHTYKTGCEAVHGTPGTIHRS